MKIQSSQITLNGSQSDKLISSKLHSMEVKVSSEAVTGSDSSANSSVNTEAERKASIRLSLSERAIESKQVSSSSTVINLSDQQVAQFSAGYLAQQITQQASELEYKVSSSQALGSDAQVMVDVVSILEVERSEGLSFEALGKVTTEDGRQIDFMMALDFNRDISIQQVNHFSGDVNLIDPLILNLNGEAVELSDKTFEFDINADGVMDVVSQTSAGSGYLVFDENQNGQIDNGNEMFGPQTGRGFEELGLYDSDGNGWIDENDLIYSQLQFMSFSVNPETGEEEVILQSLADAGIGALFLGSVASDYALNSASGDFKGKIKQTGVALSETGQTLLLQEVHLKNFLREPADAITEVSGSIQLGEEGVIDIENPLSFFQFDDAVLNTRNEETLVSVLPAGDFQSFFSAIPLRRLSENSSEFNRMSRFMVTDFTIESAGALSAQGKVEDHSLDLRNWVNETIRIAKANNEFVSLSSEVQQPQPAYESIAQAESPFKDMLNLEEENADMRLSEMRSMIEALREIRKEQQLIDNSRKELSTYQLIGRFSEL